MAFSASESAFEGFRVIRREPMAIAVWAVFYFVASLLTSAAFLPVMRTLSSATAAGKAGALYPGFWGALLTFYGVLISLGLVVGAVICCAVYRAVLRPQDKGLARLSFGADELRLIGLWIVVGLLFFGLILLLGVVAGVAIGAFALAARNNPAGPIAAVLLIYLLMFGAFAWLGTRLSLAGPLTFAERRLHVFKGWRLTRKRFWALLGCYLLALVLALVIWMVVYAVMGAIGFAATGGSVQGLISLFIRPDYSSLQAYFSPLRILYTLLLAPVGAIGAAITFAPAASAYKAITGTGAEQQAEVFE